MARRSLSTQGRILAAGVTVAVGGALVGFMAAGDHTADASATTSSNSSSSNSSSASTPGDQGTSATPYDGQSSSGPDRVGGSSGNTGFTPQAQTRTGGS